MPFTAYIESIKPSGLLSFAPDTPPLELRPLNVLIGPNASGKSNLIDILGLIRSMPTDLQEPMRGGGGTLGWLWKAGSDSIFQTPSLELSLQLVDGPLLIHKVMLEGAASPPYVLGVQFEQIVEWPNTIIYESDLAANRIAIRPHNGEISSNPYPEQHRKDQSALAQFRSPQNYPAVTYLGFVYDQIRIYNGWEVGRRSSLRYGQPADLRGDRLEEDYSNLGVFLNQMAAVRPDAKANIREALGDLYERFSDYEVVVYGGSVQIFFSEGSRGRQMPVPAARVSDGALRYLCLLAILYNPNPPPVVCIEEPELGLHPDVVAGLAKHLRAASERMQLIVTTHSDILIDALSDTPESVVVFANHKGATQMTRLNADDLRVWLEKYSLGQLWTSGQIGGTRW